MADLSPEFASEIQKLEANYASNPGRFFVPLASKWRDAGDVAMAERILRENIGKFPGLSAHVLLGRCLADRGAFPEAANEFHYVLSIDSQNLIALRTLAEMAAAAGKRADAERWYNELLAVDPMNAEARSALAQLARAGTAPAEPAEPAAPQWGDVSDDVAAGAALGDGDDGDGGGEFGMIDLDAPDASPADASGVAADEPEDGGMDTWGDLTLDATPAPEPASAEPAAGGDLDGFGFVDLDAEPAPAGADASGEWTDVDARQDVGETAAADLGDLPLLDDGMIDAPLAGADLPFIQADADADATVDGGEFGALVDEPGAGFGFGEPSPAAAGDADHVFHEADGHDADAEMVTETMAELYASQGLLAQAADVYRELIGQRGHEPGLTRRLGELEARIAGAPVETPPLDETADAPDWLQSVDDFARGADDAEPAEFTVDGGLPARDLTPATTDAFSFGTEADASDFGTEPDAPEFSLGEPAPSAFSAVEPEAAPSADPFADSFAAGFDGAAEPAMANAGPEPAGEWMEPVAADAGAEAGSADGADVLSADAGAEPASAPAGADTGPADGADAFAADAGAQPGSADAGATDDRQAWQAPTVAETEPVGFDILVVEDEDGGEVPAPPEVVADVSADWAIAAAPLDDDEQAADAELAAASTGYGPGGRTMRGYFSSLLTWQPAPAEAPTYEISAQDGTLTIEPAEPASAEAPGDDVTPSASTPSVDAAPSIDATSSIDTAPSAGEAPSTDDRADAAGEEPAPWEAAVDAPAFPAAPAIPTFDAPAFAPPQPPAPAPADDEPWAAASAEDEPWATPGESAPTGSAEPAPGGLPLLDLDEPWAETPAAPARPVDIAGFELAEDAAPSAEAAPSTEAAPADAAPSTEPASAGDAQAEELLPWEVPAQPAAAAPETPAASDAGGGFSFEDFFSGAPSAPAESAPAAPAAQPEPSAPPQVDTPAFIPSFAEPTPPPVFEAPTPAPAPAAPPAAAAPQAGGQDEDDEDLESFQAWLQSLKR